MMSTLQGLSDSLVRVVSESGPAPTIVKTFIASSLRLAMGSPHPNRDVDRRQAARSTVLVADPRNCLLWGLCADYPGMCVMLKSEIGTEFHLSVGDCSQES